jgi:sugar/nucleoside kinase (ribokinase family)
MPNSRSETARSAAAGLHAFADRRASTPAIIGFDGFVDSIITVVEKRHDATRFDAVPTIARLGEKISAAAGKSSNYELVTRLQKLGGNGPIMANAMTRLGLPVTYLGALGYPALHPVFTDFARTANVISFANPGLTDALEFDDGKLMLGKLQPLNEVTWDRLVQAAGLPALTALLEKSRFIAAVNWTMLPHLSEIFNRLSTDLLPKLSHAPGGISGGSSGGARRRVFVDLADPEKRTRSDLQRALELVAAFEKHCDTTLGVNHKEALQVVAALGLSLKGEQSDDITLLAAIMRAELSINTVVVHDRRSAAASCHTEAGSITAFFEGPFVSSPALSTGAGDNFNAGFSIAQLAGLTLEQCLCVGTATSGFYVRNAASPTLEQLASFCENLPVPE